MGLWNKIKNALVPRRSIDEDLREQRDTWKEEAKEYKKRYFDLREEFDSLKKDVLSLREKVRVLEERLEAKNKVIEKQTDDSSKNKTGDNLTPREKKLFKIVTNNAERIKDKEDILKFVKKKIGVEWKQSTLDVYLSRIKKKGKGDLRRFFN